MSASSKKKLRKEQKAAAMTERQMAEQKEAKKLKIYTLSFWIVMALCVCLVAGLALRAPVVSLVRKATTAVIVGDHKLSAVELNYFYVDAINEYCNQYSSYLSYFLDTSKPLNEQDYDKESGTTWDEAFLDMALDSAKNTYALYDAAVAAGHKLSDDEQKAVDDLYANMDTYAEYYGYSSVNGYLKAFYGNGASEKSYCDYYEVTVLASSYYNAYTEDLRESYDDPDLREYEKDKMHEYNAYSYYSHYMSVDDFKTGGTKGEDGKITYSAEEIAAAEKALKEAAEKLAVSDNNTLDALNAAIKALEISMEKAESADKKDETDKKAETKTTTEEPTTDAADDKKEETSDDKKEESTDDKKEEDDKKYSKATENKDILYSKVTSAIQEWIKDAARKQGDIKAIPYETTSTDKDGKETKTLKGYYVVLFDECNDNTYALKNVRHLLVSFEGGTTDKNGNKTYSDTEKAAAKTKAEKFLEEWKKGDKTEDSFAELAKKNSTDTGSKENGGLYEDVYPGQMVEAFEDWCYDEARKPGDTGIVETTYGYHVMFFSGDSEVNYRDYMVTNDLLESEVNEWQEALNKAMTVTEKNTNHIDRDMILKSGS